MTIRAFSRTLLVSSLVFLMLAGALTVYGSSFVRQLQRQVISPEGSVSVRADMLSSIETALGPQGAIGAYRRFSRTGEPEALDLAFSRLQQAGRAIAGLADLDANTPGMEDAPEAQTLGALLQSVTGVLRDVRTNGNGPALQERINADSAELASLIRDMRMAEIMTRFDGVSRAVSMGQWVVLGLLLGAFGFILGAVALIRMRILAPLEELSRDVHDLGVAVADGAPGDVSVWGIARSDEIGEIARGCEYLRRSTLQVLDPDVRPVMEPEPHAREAEHVPGGRDITLAPPVELQQTVRELRDAIEGLRAHHETLEGLRPSADAPTATVSQSFEAYSVTPVEGFITSWKDDLLRLVSRGETAIEILTERAEDAARGFDAAQARVSEAAQAAEISARSQADALKGLADSASEHVSQSIGNLSISDEMLNAIVSQVESSQTLLSDVVHDLRTQVSASMTIVADDSERIHDASERLDTTARDTAKTLSRTQAAFHDTACQLLRSVADAVKDVRLTRDTVNAAVREAGLRTREDERIVLPAIEALRETISTQITQLRQGIDDHLPRRELIESLDQRSHTAVAELTEIRTLLDELLDELDPGEAGETADGTRFEEIAERIASSMGQLAGHVDRTRQEHDATRSAISRYQDDIRSAMQGLTGHIDQVAGAIDGRFGALRDDLETVASRLQTTLAATRGSEDGRIEAIRTAIEEVMSPITEGEARDGTQNALTILMDQLAGLSAQLQEMSGTLEASRPEGGSNAAFATLFAQIAGLADRLDVLSTHLPSGPATQDSPLGDVLMADEAGLPQGGDARALQDVLSRVSDAARSEFDRIQRDGDDAAQAETEAVLSSLSDVADQISGRRPVPAEALSLHALTRDIATLGEAIAAIEERARRVGHTEPSASEENGERIVSGKDIEAALLQLHTAMQRLGSVASSMALAGEGSRAAGTASGQALTA